MKAGIPDTHVIISDDGDTSRITVPVGEMVNFITQYSGTAMQNRGSVYEIPGKDDTSETSMRRLQFRVEGSGNSAPDRYYAEAYSACVSLLVDEWRPERGDEYGHVGALVLARDSDQNFAMVFPGVVMSARDLAEVEKRVRSRVGELSVFRGKKIFFPRDTEHWPVYGSAPRGFEDPLKALTGLVPEEANAWDWNGIQRSTEAAQGTVLGMRVSCSDLLAMASHSLTPGSELVTRANIGTNKEYLFWMAVSCSCNVSQNTPRVCRRQTRPAAGTAVDLDDEKDSEGKNDFPNESSCRKECTERFMIFDTQLDDIEVDPNVESSMVGTLTRKEAVRKMLKNVKVSFFGESALDAKRSVARGLVEICMGKRMARELAEDEMPGFFDSSDFESGSRYDRASFMAVCHDGNASSLNTWTDSFCIRMLDNASKSLTNDDLVSYVREIYGGFMVLSSTGQTKFWYTYDNGFWRVDSGGSKLDVGVKDRMKKKIGREITSIVSIRDACADLRRRMKGVGGGQGSIAGVLAAFCGEKRVQLGLQDQEFYSASEALGALCWHLDEASSTRIVAGCDIVQAEKLAEICSSLSDAHTDRVDAMRKLLIKIKTFSWWTGTKKSMNSYFLDTEFRTRLDANGKLLGMQNGVFDLDKGCMRQAMPCDFLSKKMPFSYVEYESGDPALKETAGIIARIFPNQKLREYFWQMVALMLEGKNITKTIQLWTGVGDNGKTVLMNFLKKMFGPYFAVIPTTCVTGKKPAAGKATPELAKLGGGVRVVFMNEPNQNEELNTATLKNWSGNDPMYVRALFDNGFEMIPMFKIVIICNDLPRVGNHDAAFWGRMRVVPFESRFTHGAPEDKAEQWEQKHFARDDAIEASFEALAPALFFLVVQMHNKIHSPDGGVRLVDPDEVKVATESYRSTSNCYNLFVDQIFDMSEGSEKHAQARVRKLPAVYSMFKSWFRDSFPKKNIHCLPMFMRAMVAVIPDIETLPMLAKADLNEGNVYGNSHGQQAVDRASFEEGGGAQEEYPY